MDFPGQNTGVGSLSLLQGIFPTQGSNPGLPHCRRILYYLSQNSIKYFLKVQLGIKVIAAFIKKLCFVSVKAIANHSNLSRVHFFLYNENAVRCREIVVLLHSITDWCIRTHILVPEGLRNSMTNRDSIFKSRDITLPTKVHLVKAMVFPVVMYGCESWTIKKAEHRRIDAGVGEDSWESLGLKGDQTSPS